MKWLSVSQAGQSIKRIRKFAKLSVDFFVTAQDMHIYGIHHWRIL